MKKKSKIIAVLAILLVVIVIFVTVILSIRKSSKKDTNIVYKETSVEKGNLVAGITESGSVSIGTVKQNFDLDTTTASTSSSGTSTSSSTGGSSMTQSQSSAGSGQQSAGGSQSASQTASSSNQSSASSTSATSSVALEVEDVYVTTGQKVNQGDPILKLTADSVSEYKESLQEAVTTATLAVKQAKLSAQTQKLEADYSYNSNIAGGNVAQSEYDSTIASLQSAVDEAQTAVNESNAKIADYQNRIAAGEDLTSQLSKEQSNLTGLQSKLTSAQNSYTTKAIEAKATYDEAMLNYNNASSIRSIDTNGIQNDVKDAEDTLANAKDALGEFQTTIGDGVIYAEYTGTIMELGYAAGDTLSSSTSIATYADDTAVTIIVSVSQEDISAVAIGEEVQIGLSAYEGEVFTGTVTSMDTTTSSDTSTVSYSVTILFTGDVHKVYADMTGEVTFVTKEVSDVVYVSNKAIINDGTKSYVKVKDSDGTIEKREVTTGFSNGTNVEIKSGLSKGETALIESQVKQS